MNLSAVLPPGLSSTLIIEILAGLANVVALIILFRAFAPGEVVNARARAHAKRRRELRDNLLAQPRRSHRSSTKPVTAVRGLLERLKLTRGEEVRKATESLARAGWRTPDALTLFLGFRLGAPAVLGVLAFLLVPLLMRHASPLIRPLAALVGAIAGAYVPSIVVGNAAKKRQQLIQKQLPDALDLFVICAEAGLGMDATFSRVAREIAPNGSELADELGLTAIELGFLPNRRDALANLSKRTEMASIRSLVNTLGQSERYGTPLAQSMRVLADEFRNDRMMKAEEKAARLPATLTIPLIVFILPPLFIVLIGPAIIQVLATISNK
jgi:tight adherence protein C